MTKKCPECAGVLVANAVACACGWKSKPPAAAKPLDGPDPEPWRCSFEMLGKRCPDAGPHKRGDRWYCALHAGKKPLGDTLAAEVGREGIARARAILAAAKAVPRAYEREGPRRFGDLPAAAELGQAVDEWEAGRE